MKVRDYVPNLVISASGELTAATIQIAWNTRIPFWRNRRSYVSIVQQELIESPLVTLVAAMKANLERKLRLPFDPDLDP